MKLADLTPEELSADLREGSSPFLNHRRFIVGFSLLSAGIMGGIALFQMGFSRKFPSRLFGNLIAER
jgi:hypothetical protein